MTVGKDGYTNIERYINWLGAPHYRHNERVWDLQSDRHPTGGFSAISPSYTLSDAVNGAASL